jgi:hypothetical protein|tara:strand:+ start:414 stop:602 length:189 start_codon:yes stop_codon:yes gene_type:complete
MAVIIGKRATVVKDLQTANGMLYKSSTVIVRDKICSCKTPQNIAVEQAGRRYWVKNEDILIK